MPSDNTTYQPHIPDAVRRASQRADELAREAGVAGMPPLEEPPQDPSQEPPAARANTTVVYHDAPPFELTPPTQEQEPEPQQPPPPPEVDWEQRYATLQGKYNNEIPELRGQVRSLQDLLASMQSQPRAAPEPVRSTMPPPSAREIPNEDIENYGQDLIAGTQRWAEARLMPRIQELEQRLLSVEGGNVQLANYTAGQRVEMHLDREIPDWRSINVDNDFILWLGQVDPFSGQTRKRLIDDAYGAGDANRTAAFFRSFKSEHTAVSGRPGTQMAHTEQSTDRLPLADLAVPGRGSSVSSPAPGAPQRRIWTGPEINAFYRQKQRGAWIGREAEADRIEQDIINAPVEGRFRQ